MSSYVLIHSFSSVLFAPVDLHEIEDFLEIKPTGFPLMNQNQSLNMVDLCVWRHL